MSSLLGESQIAFNLENQKKREEHEGGAVLQFYLVFGPPWGLTALYKLKGIQIQRVSPDILETDVPPFSSITTNVCLTQSESGK